MASDTYVVLQSEAIRVVTDVEECYLLQADISVSQDVVVTLSDSEKYTTTLTEVEGSKVQIGDVYQQLVLQVPPPQDTVFTYNPDGTLATSVKGGVTTTYTYSAGLLSSTNDGVYLRSFQYNVDDQLESVTITEL